MNKYNTVESIVSVLNEIFECNKIPHVIVEAPNGFDFFIKKLHRTCNNLDKMAYYSTFKEQVDQNELMKVRRFIKMYRATFHYSPDVMRKLYRIDQGIMDSFCKDGIVRTERSWEKIQKVYRHLKKLFQEAKERLVFLEEEDEKDE